ncbi:cupin domain-containing protein [Derxia gummosa]|uniref:Cupin domain-containing protein n=1 Tax=Derxia gummosa DSM 723 TaxID=1121388 RepID=A0A8B6XA42_9BURK|nr:cupin domain-containing protein [Derxia gummosa]
MTRTFIAAAFCAAGLLLAAAPAGAQTPAPITRTVVGKGDVSVPGREAIVARVEIAPGATVARHTHAGDEIGYIAEGEVEMQIDGEAPRLLKAGESFVIPAGVVHGAHNHSATGVKLIGVYVVEKGKPLATPAP